jgi:hypothetical protein
MQLERTKEIQKQQELMKESYLEEEDEEGREHHCREPKLQRQPIPREEIEHSFRSFRGMISIIIFMMIERGIN